MRSLVLVFFLFVSGVLCGQTVPQKAPVDTSYHISVDEYLEMKTNGILLPPIKPAFNPWGNYSHHGNRDFSAIYDMRDSSWLTPVKSQSAGGCWAYSAMGAVESRWLMLEMGTYDLSDNNLKYCHKYLPERSTNGNHWMASAYFARRSDLILRVKIPIRVEPAGLKTAPTIWMQHGMYINRGTRHHRIWMQ